MAAFKYAFDRGGTPVELKPGETLIGSDQDCAIRIEGTEAVQASVRIEGDEVSIESRGTQEDIRINDLPARVAELSPGDDVRFGEARLTLEKGDSGLTLSGPAGSFPLSDGENPVGRSPEGKVVLNDGSVSRDHAIIVVLPGLRVLMRDLRSSNGTFVGDRRLGEAQLKTGDTVEIGKEKLTFVATQLPGAAAQPAASSGPKEFKLLVGTELRPLSPGRYSIGRSADRDITVEDNEVSGNHAEIVVTADAARLRDVGSSNGTRVNGQQISGEVVLKDGDTISMGRSDLMFTAPVGDAGLDKTVLSGSLPDLGKTVVSGGAGAPAMPPPPAKATPDSPLALLDLQPGASQEAIQKKFQELYSEYQIRLTNAPTPDLKNKFQQKLEELQAARDKLIAPAAAGGLDLPAAEPVHGSAAPEPPPAPEPAPEPAPPAASKGRKKKAKPKKAAAAKAPKQAPAEPGERFPASAKVMAVISLVAILATAGLWVFSRSAITASADKVQELADLQASIVAMQERIPQAEQEILELQEGKMSLLENSEFKICNLSSASVWVVWLHSTYVSDDGKFQSFDSAFFDYETWEVPAGGTVKFGYVKDDQVVWDGSTVFFTVLMQYRGKEIFRSGAWSGIGSDCYNLALDN